MTAWLVLGVSVAGGIGAIARLVVDGIVKAHVRARFPVGTLLINVTGSFLLGVVAGLAMRGIVDPTWHALLGTGFMGGYTTFSTASVDAVRLLLDRRWGPAIGYGLGGFAAALAAVALGFAVASF
jgi:fluoride exporter